MKTKVTTTHLFMTSPSHFQPKYTEDKSISLEKVRIPNPNLNHFFYVNVGILFKWYSRLSWTYDDWVRYVHKDNVHTWVGYIEGSPYGYFELEEREDETEIMFFGILKQFFGRGYGAHLLSCAIREAWNLERTKRVYVHTCTLDHAAALHNYEARGFIIDREVTELEDVPSDKDEIWKSSKHYESL